MCASAKACTQGCLASARLAYTVLFTVSLISAWVLRDHGAGLMSQISWVDKEVKGDPLGQHQQFYGAQAVYRVSIGSALFFMLNAAALYKVKLRSDPRDRWLHHGSWFVKFPLWLLCCVLPFLLPNGAVEAYSWVARLAGRSSSSSRWRCSWTSRTSGTTTSSRAMTTGGSSPSWLSPWGSSGSPSA